MMRFDTALPGATPTVMRATHASAPSSDAQAVPEAAVADGSTPLPNASGQPALPARQASAETRQFAASLTACLEGKLGSPGTPTPSAKAAASSPSDKSERCRPAKAKTSDEDDAPAFDNAQLILAMAAIASPRDIQVPPPGSAATSELATPAEVSPRAWSLGSPRMQSPSKGPRGPIDAATDSPDEDGTEEGALGAVESSAPSHSLGSPIMADSANEPSINSAEAAAADDEVTSAPATTTTVPSSDSARAALAAFVPTSPTSPTVTAQGSRKGIEPRPSDEPAKAVADAQPAARKDVAHKDIARGATEKSTSAKPTIDKSTNAQATSEKPVIDRATSEKAQQEEPVAHRAGAAHPRVNDIEAAKLAIAPLPIAETTRGPSSPSPVHPSGGSSVREHAEEPGGRALPRADAKTEDPAEEKRPVKGERAGHEDVAMNVVRQDSSGVIAPREPARTENHRDGGQREPNGVVTDDARAARQDSAELAVSRMALRSGTHTEAYLPEMGRFSVDAHRRNDLVDIDLRADSRELTVMLDHHSPELVADLRAANIHVGGISVDFGGGGAPQSQSQRPDSSSRMVASDRNTAHSKPSEDVLDLRTRRVRIVL
jgi:hypothetical protein